MSKAYAQRRTAGDGIVTKPSSRTLKAREALPQSVTDADAHAQTPAPAIKVEGPRSGIPSPSSAEARNMFVYRGLVRPMTCAELAESIGLNYKTVYTALDDMLEAKVLVRMPGNDGRITKVAGQGWSDEELRDVVYIPKKGKPKNPTPSAYDLTVRIPEGSRPSYARAFEDISRLHYGVKEIDDAITALRDMLRARLSNVDYMCPLCGKAVDVTGTAVHCKRCAYTIDVGDVVKAIRLAGSMASDKEEGSE